ncbi:hypothetical protein HK414_02825 [Ramlibacter terrae]|uniref:Retention module-containing protein n=1 Tax=Ramlibacter terrae TaxID=2732511 RepID=A0ABX6P1A4_9BURK|nr:hypothetical protein HK414_02825 [Ramlibacter terrae]
MEPRVVGTVVLIEGVVLARSPDGKQRQLKHGDAVYEGEILTALADAHVELAFAHGGRFLLRSSESVTLNGVLFDNVFGQSDEDGRGTLLGRVAEATDPTRIETEGQPRTDRPLDDDGNSAELNDRVGVDLGNGFVRLDRIAEPLAGTKFAYHSADGTPCKAWNTKACRAAWRRRCWCPRWEAWGPPPRPRVRKCPRGRPRRCR